MKRSKLVLPLLLALLAAPIFAGSVYVPYASDVTVGGQQYEIWVWASNDYPDILGLAEHFFIPSFQDGTDRELESTQVWLTPGETRVLDIGGGNVRGMLEIEASSEVHLQARLVPVGGSPADGQGVSLPIVSSDNVIPAGEKVHLLGWEREANGALSSSNFGLLNLGHSATECSVDVNKANGEVVIANVILNFAALSHNQFDNVLALLGETNDSNWRLSIVCDRPYFPYLSIYYPATGRLTFVEAAANGRSDLAQPGGGGGGGPSEQFEYLSDLPVDRWGGLEIGPLIDRTGIDFHASPIRHSYKKLEINGVEYDKGISFYPRWSQVPFVEFRLNGNYALFTADVRVDDDHSDDYEWAVVNTSTGNWERLERPSDGYRGRERTNPIRVSSALTFRVIGDGVVLYQGPEVYAYGPADKIEVDVTGVQVLRLQGHPDGTERVSAPHRNGLTQNRLVRRCPWFDLINFADAKIFLPEQ